jgi:hypothetical protein
MRKVPRAVASLVTLLLFLSAVQAQAWNVRPPPDWHPAWWQSSLWAHIGMLLEAPAILVGAAFCELAGMNWSLFARGFMCGIAFLTYLVIVYVIVFRVVRWIIVQFDYTPPKNHDSN